MTDLQFLETEQPTMANFNKRFAALGPVLQHHWRRRPLFVTPAYYELGDLKNQNLLNSTSTSTTRTYVYGGEISINSDGSILFVGETGETVVSYSAKENANVLKGKYYYNETLGGFYSPADVADATAQGSGSPTTYGVLLKGQKITTYPAVTEYGEWEMVVNSDRNAYPDSGIADGYEYRYLGTPLENAILAPGRFKLKELVDDVGGSNQIDIDVSDINLADWDYIEIVPNGLFTNDTQSLGVRFNSISESQYRYASVGQSNSNAQDRISVETLGPPDGTSSEIRMRLFVVNGIIVCTFDDVLIYSTHTTVNKKSLAAFIAPSALAADALETINFFVSSASAFNAGAKFTIYGVRK